MKSYQIHLIRHGMTKANENGQYIGTTDLPLSDDGKKQLSYLKDKYKYPEPGVIYTSPLKRCTQTCNILYPEHRIISVPGLTECDFGAFEGKTAEQLKDNERFKLWLNDSGNNAPPNGESGLEFAHRVCFTFEKLVQGLMKTGTQTATIITHAGVLTTLLSAYGIPRANPFDWMTDSGCGYSLRITPSFWMRDMVAEVYQKLPIGNVRENDGEYAYLMDIAREAADRAYGEDSKKE